MSEEKNNLRDILNHHGFTEEESKMIIGSNIDKATNITELWAHWFSFHGKSDEEFTSERFPNLSVEKAKVLLDLVHEFQDTQEK